MPEIEVCLGPECDACGGPDLLQTLREAGLEAAGGHCRGLCHEAPVAGVDGELVPEANSEKLRSLLT